MPKTPIQRLSYPSIENVVWLAHNFEVLPSWIDHELAKGYMLTDIYEGLLERQRGGSYERFMQLRYDGAFELKHRKKRVAPVVVAAVRAAPVVVSAARAAAPAIVKTARTASTAVVNATKATVSYVKDVGKSASSYINNAAKSTKEFFTGPSQPAPSAVRVTSSIKKSNHLVNHAEKLSKRHDEQRQINHLTKELFKGNSNPGTGNRYLGFGRVHEARTSSGARLYFQNTRGGFDIVAKSTKDNQKEVIKELRRMYGN
ncbi:hypothetical protein PPOP_3143 [Paenibacillus popilliae ATCC 14706]|uniref:Uncharacterized protein n=1 Tax=Paenibacillus popilliae ATCC 14706 TaxID=1212764 RepID=M9M7L2_PAEPP|nr:hypothetical protein PPOP_3143 [Paenibacillus popilliae ATCC 14706]